ncbi:MAG: carboxymuconolactone decarboxylase family protein [Proteobacteria bacterium]|nr:carboxymuconolactone decarboxylase family protein [Pseudomonadota bacterium]
MLHFHQVTEQYPDVAWAHEKLGTTVHTAGPLTHRERLLVKFALAVGARLEGGAHAQVRRALESGVTGDELRHVALLAIPTIGFPPSMAAMSWIDDIDTKKPKGRRKARR